jgi:hypothetical protein
MTFSTGFKVALIFRILLSCFYADNVFRNASSQVSTRVPDFDSDDVVIEDGGCGDRSILTKNYILNLLCLVPSFSHNI